MIPIVYYKDEDDNIYSYKYDSVRIKKRLWDFSFYIYKNDILYHTLKVIKSHTEASVRPCMHYFIAGSGGSYAIVDTLSKHEIHLKHNKGIDKYFIHEDKLYLYRDTYHWINKPYEIYKNFFGGYSIRKTNSITGEMYITLEGNIRCQYKYIKYGECHTVLLSDKEYRLYDVSEYAELTYYGSHHILYVCNKTNLIYYRKNNTGGCVRHIEPSEFNLLCDQITYVEILTTLLSLNRIGVFLPIELISSIMNIILRLRFTKKYRLRVHGDDDGYCSL